MKSHPFFAGINWDTLLQQKALFLPRVENDEDTAYFDSMPSLTHHGGLDGVGIVA